MENYIYIVAASKKWRTEVDTRTCQSLGLKEALFVLQIIPSNLKDSILRRESGSRVKSCVEFNRNNFTPFSQAVVRPKKGRV